MAFAGALAHSQDPSLCGKAWEALRSEEMSCPQAVPPHGAAGYTFLLSAQLTPSPPSFRHCLCSRSHWRHSPEPVGEHSLFLAIREFLSAVLPQSENPSDTEAWGYEAWGCVFACPDLCSLFTWR